LDLLVNLISWGTNFIDYDNDGRIDLYVVASCISGTGNGGTLGCSWNGGQSDVLPTNNVLFHNEGNGQFSDVSEYSGLNEPYLTTGTAIGDINNDGLIDIYEVNELDPISAASNYSRLYRNNYAQVVSEQNFWIKVKLEGVESNRNGIGSRIEVTTSRNTQIQEVICGDSYSSQSSLTLSFGLNDEVAIEAITVRWTSGTVDRLYNVPANQVVTIEEGSTLDCPAIGNVNGDVDSNENDTFNVLDVVLLANCVLVGNCSDNCGAGGLPNNGTCYACAADVNADFNYNVLDIVQLANCVLGQNCGG